MTDWKIAYGQILRGELQAHRSMQLRALLALGQEYTELQELLDQDPGFDALAALVQPLYEALLAGLPQLEPHPDLPWSADPNRLELEALAEVVFAQEPVDLDAITAEYTGFKAFAALLDVRGGYRPSLASRSGLSYGPLAKLRDRRLLTALADAYVEAQAARGDARRAYRW
jgi:hypothetical protein